jgi:hypothetical protein
MRTIERVPSRDYPVQAYPCSKHTELHSEVTCIYSISSGSLLMYCQKLFHVDRVILNFGLLISGMGIRYSDGLWAGRPGFDFRQCKIYLFYTASRPALGPTQPPIQRLSGGKTNQLQISCVIVRL